MGDEMQEIRVIDPARVHRVNIQAQEMLKHMSTFLAGIAYRQCLRALELWEEDWE